LLATSISNTVRPFTLANANLREPDMLHLILETGVQSMRRLLYCAVLITAALSFLSNAVELPDTVYVYQSKANIGATAYDEALAVACLQGLINRDQPLLYVVSAANARPQYWLDILSKDGAWLAGKTQTTIK